MSFLTSRRSNPPTSHDWLPMISRKTFPWLLLIGLLLFTTSAQASSTSTCTTDEECHASQGELSTCGSDGVCTNPYESGCLYQRLPGWTKKRVCNSEDPEDAAERGICVEPAFDYLEVRSTSGNWESSTFNAWLMQILFSEMLGVPTTIEAAAVGDKKSFYEPHGAFGYGQSDTGVCFENAHKYKDCRLADKSEEGYENCANICPELWSGSALLEPEAIQNRITEPPEALGVLARETL